MTACSWICFYPTAKDDDDRHSECFSALMQVLATELPDGSVLTCRPDRHERQPIGYA